MKTHSLTRKIIFLAFLALLVLSVIATTAYAQGAFDLSWWTVDSGGAINLSTGDYSLSGAVGQPDAGALSSGEYALSGGFWTSAPPPAGSTIYLPLMAK